MAAVEAAVLPVPAAERSEAPQDVPQKTASAASTLAPSDETPASTESPAPDTQYVSYVGRVKSYNPKQGYGFLESTEAHSRFGRDVFIHKAQMGELLGRFVGPGTRLEPTALRMRVRFSVEVNKQGMPQAREVQQLEGQDDASEDGSAAPVTGDAEPTRPGRPSKESSRAAARPSRTLRPAVPSAVCIATNALGLGGASGAVAENGGCQGDDEEWRGASGFPATGVQQGGPDAPGCKGSGGTFWAVSEAEAQCFPGAPAAPAMQWSGGPAAHLNSAAQAGGGSAPAPLRSKSKKWALGYQAGQPAPGPIGRGAAAAHGAKGPKRRGQPQARGADWQGPVPIAAAAATGHGVAAALPQCQAPPAPGVHQQQVQPVARLPAEATQPQHNMVAFQQVPFVHPGLSSPTGVGLMPSPGGHQGGYQAFSFMPQQFSPQYAPDPSQSTLAGPVYVNCQFQQFPQHGFTGYSPHIVQNAFTMPAHTNGCGCRGLVEQSNPLEGGCNGVESLDAYPAADTPEELYSPQMVSKEAVYGCMPTLDLPFPEDFRHSGFPDMATPNSGSEDADHFLPYRMPTPEPP